MSSRSSFSSFAALAAVAAGLAAMPGSAQPAAQQSAAQAAAKKPVCIFLYSRVTDHVNLDISEDQLRRVLPMVERYQREHPEQHVHATVFFSGAVSQALAERNQQTHIRDFVLDYIHRGVIQAGYDGADEPTYTTRPTVDLTKDQTPQERWKALIAEQQSFLSTGRDPLTGAPKPGTAGGLKEMQEVFGEASCIIGVEGLLRSRMGGYTPMAAPSGAHAPGVKPPQPPPPSPLMPEVGGDTEAVLAIRGYNTRAIMFGLPDANAAQLPGFGGARSGFTKIVNPSSDTSPELYWQDGVLRTSETSGDEVKLVRATDGVAALQKVTTKADRSSVRVIHVEIGGENGYVKPEFAKSAEYPPTRYAYIHTDKPTLPETDVLPKADVDAGFTKQEEVLKWLTTEYLPANPGSGFVSGEDLSRMAEPANGYSIGVPALRSALAEFLKQWGNNTYAPSLFAVEGHYLSRAELFQVMADALAEFHRSGKLPETVTVAQVHGPLRMLSGHGPNEGQLDVATIAKQCAEIAPALHDTSGEAAEIKAIIPIGITINGVLLNPAQFVRLMAQALQNPEPKNKVDIKMAYEYTALGEFVPKSRPATDCGFVWTLKPVTLRANQMQAQAR